MPPFVEAASPPATRRTGSWIAVTASDPMLVFGRPDGLHVTPSALTYTPRSVPAATNVRANPKTRTERPSRPLTVAHVVPASLLTNAPPRVPASTRPPLKGLNATVSTPAGALPATFQVDPPSPLLSKEPAPVPATRTWLFVGPTASAKIALCPCSGNGASATQVEGGGVAPSTETPADAQASSVTSVARRRLLGSDTSLPIITQCGPPTGGAAGGRGCRRG